jgi:RNA polymerase sigma-70 factor (ECF subfamily)
MHKRKNPDGPKLRVPVLTSGAVGKVTEADMACLKKPQRDVILAAEVRGATYKSIAAALNCPMGSVRSRLSRARGHILKDRKRRALLARTNGCTYPRCKCIVSTSTSQPMPVCPHGLEQEEPCPAL